MGIDVNIQTDTVVQTLLHIGERVVEISRELVINRIWERADSPRLQTLARSVGRKMHEVRNDAIVMQSIEMVKEGFATGRDSYVTYTTIHEGKAVTAGIRVLMCHPDPDLLFVVIENLARPDSAAVIEDRWKLALDASGMGMWDANMENGLIFFSDKWHEIFGYGADEIITSADWSSKIFAEDMPGAEKKYRMYLAGETPIYSAEMRYRCKDGTYKWILSRGVAVSKKDDGTPLRFIGTHSDISNRKKGEEELKTSKENFSNAFSFSGIGKALLAMGGQWVEVNDVICQLTEYTKEELLALHYRDITYPEDIDIDLELIMKLLNKEMQSYCIEKRYVSKSRKVISTLLTVTLLWDNDGNPKYFICEVVDLTQKKELTDEIKRMNFELETTANSLIDKVEQIEEMHRKVAHNLRGPVGNIKLLSADNGMFKDKEALKMIHDCSKSLMSDLELLLDLAQIKSNKSILFEQCEFRSVIDNIVAQLQGIFYEKNVELVLDLEVERIMYPHLYLESVVYNLINNSIKYSRRDVRPQIVITTREKAGKIQLSVKDNGIGIDLEQYHDKIFKLYQVFHSGYDSKGVGLFIVRTQLEAVGGSIDVVSTIDEGSEFIVSF